MSTILPNLVYTGRTEPRASTVLRPRDSSGVLGDRVRRSKRQRQAMGLPSAGEILGNGRRRRHKKQQHPIAAASSPQLHLPPVKQRGPATFLTPRATAVAAVEAAAAAAEAAMMEEVEAGNERSVETWLRKNMAAADVPTQGRTIPAAPTTFAGTAATTTTSTAASRVAAPTTLSFKGTQSVTGKARQARLCGEVNANNTMLKPTVIAPIAGSIKEGTTTLGTSDTAAAEAAEPPLQAQPSRYYLPSIEGQGI